MAEVLGEDQVPDLHEAVCGGGVGGAPLGAMGGTVVPEQLRAGATGSDVAHLPEVVLVEACQALTRQADGVQPDLLGLAVADVHRHPEPVGVEPEDLGEQLPGPGDGLDLEVVAEAEVAEHLEEAQVARGATDGVEIVVLASGAHAALDRRHPWRRPGHGLLAEEVPHERHHPGVGEHRGGGMRGYQAGRGDQRVRLAGEEVVPGAPQPVGVHPSSLLGGPRGPGGDPARLSVPDGAGPSRCPNL